jgi:prephenate dehydrogenase
MSSVSAPLFSRITILGPGLLGGSLALAIQARKLTGKLSLVVRKESQIGELHHALPDAHITTDAVEAVREADLVLLCTPIGVMADLARRIAPALKPSALVSDVGSVKAPVDAELASIFGPKWVGGHPMAGSEQGGFSAARANLFEHAVTILTPTSATPAAATSTLKAFWEALGSRVTTCDPATHDCLMASISHLPHLVAAALVHNTCPESLALAGNGFKDTTRIASGSADLWQEILLWNREAVVEQLDSLIGLLQETRHQLHLRNEKGLHGMLAKANDIRSHMNSTSTAP